MQRARAVDVARLAVHDDTLCLGKQTERRAISSTTDVRRCSSASILHVWFESRATSTHVHGEDRRAERYMNTRTLKVVNINIIIVSTVYIDFYTNEESERARAWAVRHSP